MFFEAFFNALITRVLQHHLNEATHIGYLTAALMKTKSPSSPDRSSYHVARIAGRNVRKKSECYAPNYSKRMDLDGVILVIIKDGMSKTNRQITTVPMFSNNI